MEEILQHGIWKNSLPFHSIACPAFSNVTIAVAVAKYLHRAQTTRNKKLDESETSRQYNVFFKNSGKLPYFV